MEKGEIGKEEGREGWGEGQGQEGRGSKGGMGEEEGGLGWEDWPVLSAVRLLWGRLPGPQNLVCMRGPGLWPLIRETPGLSDNYPFLRL